MLEEVTQDLNDDLITIDYKVYITRKKTKMDDFYPIERFYYQRNHFDESQRDDIEVTLVKYLIVELKAKSLRLQRELKDVDEVSTSFVQ